MAKTIAIGCDHAGYIYKDKLSDFFRSKGFKVLSMGTDTAESVDYPLYAQKVCDSIKEKEADVGILICGTGVGMSIAANKHKGIRAALCTDLVMAEFTRKHNDSNVLCMGARIIAYEMAEMIAEKFLTTEFEGGRHQRRIEMLEK